MAKRNRPKRIFQPKAAVKPVIAEHVQLAFSPMVAAGFITRALNNIIKAGYLLKVGKDEDGHLLVIFRGFQGTLLDNNKTLHVQPVPDHFVRVDKDEGKAENGSE